MQKRFKLLLVSLLCMVVVLCALSIVACKPDNPCENGHAYGNPSWQWSKTDDGYSATVTLVCATDSTHTSTQTATVTSVSSGSVCTESGTVTYTAKVTVDGKDYSDVKTETVPQVGHSWDDGVWSWSKNSDGSFSATIKLTCTRDGSHTAEQPATIKHTHTDVSCETDGKDVYAASVIIGSKTYSDTKTDNIQTKTGHNWGDGVWVWTKSTTGEYKATFNRVCKNNEDHVTSTAAEVTKNHTDSTCLIEGKDVYTAKITVDGKAITDAKTVTLSIVNHNFEVKSTTDSTCYSRGETVYKCATCTETYKESKQLLSHNWDYENVTCEHGQACQNDGCGATKPALSHRYAEEVAVEYDCETDEITRFTCANCGDHYDVTTRFATGHQARDKWTMDEQSKVVMEGESCKYQITYNSVCYKCDRSISKVEEVEIHTLSASIKQYAVCNADGIKLLSCAKCDHTEEEAYSDADAHDWVAGVAQQSNENVVTYTCSHCSTTKNVVAYLESTSAQVSKDTLQNAGEIALKEANIALDDDTLANLEGTINVSADVLTEEQLANININKDMISGNVYNFNLTADNNASGLFAGKVTVSIPYELAENEDPDSIAILYITEDGAIETYRAKYSNGYAVFETEHFSYYTVTRLTPAQRCELYGHVEKTIEYPATCVSQGYTLIMCGRCGLTERIVGEPALGHNMMPDDERTREATCTTAGQMVFICQNDGCTVTNKTVIPALGHNWERTNVTPATCSSAGKETFVCGHDSAHTYTNTIAQKQHSFNAAVTAPTCTDRGYTTYTCASCNYEYVGDYRAAVGHAYVETIVEPTCTKGGYVLHKCSACDDEFRSDETPARHVWNMEQPTCGEDKVCIVCNAVGAKATGNHTISNGICSVCGQGCDHAGATVSVIDATCTEMGYTLTTCAKCGLSVTSNYVAATGHVGNTSCSVCEEKLLNEQFFTNALNSILNLNYAVTLTDVVLYPDSTSEATIKFGELNIGVDRDGKLFGCGTMVADSSISNFPVPQQIECRAIIKDGFLYAKYIVQGNNYGYGSGSMFDDITETMYVAMELEQSFDSILGIDGELLCDIIEWTQGELVPFVKSTIAGNEDKINQLCFDVVDLFFTVGKTSSGYNLSLNLNKLLKINDNLYNMPLGKAIDDVFGNGTYDMIVSFAEKALKCTVSELIKDINIDEAIAVLDKLSQIVCQDDKNTFANWIGLDKDLKDFINEQKPKTLFKLADEIFGINSNASEPITLDKVISELRAYKNKNFYEEIANAANREAESLKKDVDDVLSEIAGFSFNIVTSADGTITSATLKGGCSLFEGIATISGTFEPTKDYDALKTEVLDVCGDIKITKNNLVHYFGNDVKYEEYANGALKSIEYGNDSENVVDIYQVQYLLRNNDELMNDFMQFVSKHNYWGPISVKEKSSYIVELYPDLAYIVNADCAGWAQVQIVCKQHRAIQAHYEISIDYKGLKWHAEFDGDGDICSDTLSGSYNYSTGKMNLLVRGMHHVYEEDESKAVIPADCTQFGKQYFSCKLCGDSYIHYYTTDHGEKRYEYEFETERDCTKGVFEIEYCAVCNKETNRNWSHQHVGYSSNVADKFAALGGCGDCGIELQTCICGKYTRYQPVGMVSSKEYDGWVCAKDCGITLRHSLETDRDGCTAIYTTTWKVYFKGELVSDKYQMTFEGESHNIVTFGVLIDGAKSCEDGWYIVSKCLRCGYIEHSEEDFIRHDHNQMTQYIIFADEYDVDNEGYLCIYGCACGQMLYDVELRGEYESQYDYETNGTLYMFKDGFTVRRTEKSDKDENCRVTVSYIFELGVDVANGTYIDKVVFEKDWEDYYTHSYRISKVELANGAQSCVDGVWVMRKCDDCGYETEAVLSYEHVESVSQTIDLAVYGAKCGEVLQINTCACGERHWYDFASSLGLDFDIDDGNGHLPCAEAEGKRLYRVACAVTNPKCDLEFYYIEYTVTDEIDDPVLYRVIASNVNIVDYGFTADMTQYVIYREVQHCFSRFEEKNGCSVTSGERCDTCGATRYVNVYENHTYEVLEFLSQEGKLCYGPAHVKCSLCGHEEYDKWMEQHDFKRVEEVNGCETRIFDLCQRCGAEQFVNVSTNHDYVYDNVASTCTKFGHVHTTCSKCDYNDFNYISPTSHDFSQFVDDMMVCSVCGMKNINGADGMVVLEDLTSSDNPDALVVGYWIQYNDYYKRNDWSNDFHISVTLINLDAENEEDEEILVDGISFNYGDQEISFSKTDADNFAGENGITNYHVRLAFVSINNRDLVYAVTFE